MIFKAQRWSSHIEQQPGVFQAALPVAQEVLAHSHLANCECIVISDCRCMSITSLFFLSIFVEMMPFVGPSQRTFHSSREVFKRFLKIAADYSVND